MALQGIARRLSATLKRTRGWFASIVSIFAFLTSIATAYFTFVPIDDLRVVVNLDPFLSVDGDHNLVLTLYEAGAVTFINSGNRAVAISAARFGSRFRPAPCSSVYEKIAFEPIVVKAGEIIRSGVGLLSSGNLLILGNKLISVDEHGQMSVTDQTTDSLIKVAVDMDLCIMFDIITPDSEVFEKALIIPKHVRGQTVVDSDNNVTVTEYATVNIDELSVSKNNVAKPQVLLQERWWKW
jgi:hypothetical protein